MPIVGKPDGVGQSSIVGGYFECGAHLAFLETIAHI
jgi:hypothetical protein